METDMTDTIQAEDRALEQGSLDWTIPSYVRSNTSFEPIPDGIYDLEITTISNPFESVFDGKSKVQFIMEFTIVGGEFDGRTVRKYYTPSLNEKSHLLPLAKAIFGRDLDPNAPVNPRMFMNKRIRGLVETPDPDTMPAGKRPWPKLVRPLAMPAGSVTKVDAKDLPDIGNDHVPF